MHDIYQRLGSLNVQKRKQNKLLLVQLIRVIKIIGKVATRIRAFRSIGTGTLEATCRQIFNDEENRDVLMWSSLAFKGD